MPSPKKTPARILELTGRGPGKDAAGRAIPEPPAFRRLPPMKPMELSPEAAEHWELIIEELMRLEVTKPLDAGSLAALCESWSRFARAQRALNQALADLGEESAHIVFDHGRRLVTAVNEASREYRAWAMEFGLTPSAEMKLGTVKKEPTDGGENPFSRSQTQ